ncbi:MAG: undecaprenyl-diphosphate phosphatase, partial [Vulcanimicrobiaceae bacterium]
VGERLQRAGHAERRRPIRPLTALPWLDGAKIGLAQALALLPGISRSGVSIVAGLLLDLDHEDAARYSFLLATPVIGAAAVLELPRLFAVGDRGVLIESLVGGVLAALTAYASVAFLTRYFRSNDLRPFGWYCLIAGSLTVVLVALKVIA